MSMATCPECKSSDVRAVRGIDGSRHCLSCGYKNEVLKLAEANQKAIENADNMLKILVEIGTINGEKFYIFKYEENSEYSQRIFEITMLDKIKHDIEKQAFLPVSAGWSSDSVGSGKLVGDMEIMTRAVMSIRKVNYFKDYGEKL